MSEGVAPGGGCAQVMDLEQKGKMVGQRRKPPTSPSHCLALRWFWSHVGRSGVGPQFGRTAVVVGASDRHPTIVSVTRSLVSSVVAPECVVP
ncbi:hypothetical protein Taro_031770 [Colocasia esculenta]|uniref:Uncharacterized protein n=1 Tax=Colocasia esculenta TaxID=4460 RepID=A0A843VZY2_COLES|nr:hypothetical protein [Colocasia esculenta]